MTNTKSEDGNVVNVHITNADDIAVTHTEETEPEHFVCSTYVVSSAGVAQGTGNPPNQRVLSLDPMRKSATIQAIDNPVIVCHSTSQLTSPQNQVANVPFPEGYYLSAGASLSIDGTGQLWVVATVAAATRVSVAENRRGS
jgi:hypothetical protein